MRCGARCGSGEMFMIMHQCTCSTLLYQHVSRFITTCDLVHGRAGCKAGVKGFPAVKELVLGGILFSGRFIVIRRGFLVY